MSKEYNNFARDLISSIWGIYHAEPQSRRGERL